MLRFSDLPAPLRLVLLAARSHPREEELAEMQALTAGPMDWTRFLTLAVHHRLAPLVYYGFSHASLTGIPEAVQAELHQRSVQNAFRAMGSVRELCQLTDALAGIGIDAAVLKGVPLSHMLYGNAAARHVGDLDLLTSPERLPDQIEALRSLGYHRINPECRLTPRRLASYTGFWKDFTFRHETTGVELDLHWRLFNNRFHAANRIVHRRDFTAVKLAGCSLRVFSPLDQFIYIAAHGVSDAWTYLKSLADVSGFLRVLTPAELDEAIGRAAGMGLLDQLAAAIHMANDWMGACVSHPRLPARDVPIARAVRSRATSMLLQHDFQPVRDDPSPAEWLRLEMSLVPGPRSLIELANRFLWRPRIWKSVDLPDGLFWLYPVLGLLIPPRPHTVTE